MKAPAVPQLVDEALETNEEIVLKVKIKKISTLTSYLYAAFLYNRAGHYDIIL